MADLARIRHLIYERRWSTARAAASNDAVALAYVAESAQRTALHIVSPHEDHNHGCGDGFSPSDSGHGARNGDGYGDGHGEGDGDGYGDANDLDYGDQYGDGHTDGDGRYHNDGDVRGNGHDAHAQPGDGFGHPKGKRR